MKLDNGQESMLGIVAREVVCINTPKMEILVKALRGNTKKARKHWHFSGKCYSAALLIGCARNMPLRKLKLQL